MYLTNKQTSEIEHKNLNMYILILDRLKFNIRGKVTFFSLIEISLSELIAPNYKCRK